jgi:hypothetical protein
MKENIKSITVTSYNEMEIFKLYFANKLLGCQQEEMAFNLLKLAEIDGRHE